MSLINIENLHYNYTIKEDWVLRGIDLKVDDGEFVVVVGHNGSGKSTLAKMLNGLLIPTKGTVKINGESTKDEDNIWNIREQVGMVFQNPDNQLITNIVEEDVAFGPENLGLNPKEIRARVDWALKEVGMEDFKRDAPHNLSGGQKQRIAIAGVLAMKPKCLVLDEPTAMLDPLGRSSVISTIEKLNQSLGMTVVHITHFMDEAIKADRIVVMDKGEIALEGTPKEIFAKVNQIKEYSLDLPQVTQLALSLKDSGIDLPDDIFEVNRLVKLLCLLK